MNWIRQGGSGSHVDWFDVMQVCENGHLITALAKSEPMTSTDYCSQCGAKTLTACLNCKTVFQGKRHKGGYFTRAPSKPPSYCIGCGQALPWTAKKLESLDQIMRMGELSAADIAEVKAEIPDIMRDTPRSDVAALKIKSTLKKLGGDVYNVALKVVTDVASEYAKKTLLGGN